MLNVQVFLLLIILLQFCQSQLCHQVSREHDHNYYSVHVWYSGILSSIPVGPVDLSGVPDGMLGEYRLFYIMSILF